jgi:hypothetical protein
MTRLASGLFHRFGDNAQVEVKLPAHGAGLPGNDLLFDIVPLDPAHRAGLAGHAPVRGMGRGDAVFQDSCGHSRGQGLVVKQPRTPSLPL